MICNTNNTDIRAMMAPDGFSGALLACESVRDGAVLLHGPTGCRGHHSMMSERAFPRDSTDERLNFAERYYYGQPRVPTTCLDGDDFVFGGKEKLREALLTVVKRNPALLTVVNSPGAALIGDNVRQCITDALPETPCAIIDMPEISAPFTVGYQQGMLAMLDTLAPGPQSPQPGTVSLIGLSIVHQHWAGSVAELRRLLGMCGIKVLCAVGAGSSVAEYADLPRAACHIVVHAEYADRIGTMASSRYTGSVVCPEQGAPVGFSATEAWVTAVAHAVGVDPSPAVADIYAQRREIAQLLAHANSSVETVKGMTFSMHADASFVLPASQWLYRYLGMLPVAIDPIESVESPLATQLHDWLQEIGCGDAWRASWQAVEPDIVFGDGQLVTIAQAAGIPGVEVMLPSGSYLDFLPKALLGVLGSRWLLEQIVNKLYKFY